MIHRWTNFLGITSVTSGSFCHTLHPRLLPHLQGANLLRMCQTLLQRLDFVAWVVPCKDRGFRSSGRGIEKGRQGTVTDETIIFGDRGLSFHCRTTKEQRSGVERGWK